MGLPALDAEQYLNRGSSVGVALSSLMKVPADRRAEFKTDALNRLINTPASEYHRFLLAEFVQAYLLLSKAEQQEFEQLLSTEAYREVQTMATTWFEQGLERGLEQGIREGQRAFAVILQEKRFGLLSPEAQALVDEWPGDRLSELVDRAYHVNSPDDLSPPSNDQQP